MPMLKECVMRIYLLAREDWVSFMSGKYYPIIWQRAQMQNDE